jgi:hypothetical protein
MWLRSIEQWLLSRAASPILRHLGHDVAALWGTRHTRAFWDFPKDKDTLIIFPKTQRLADHDTGERVERSLNMHSAVALALISNLLWRLDRRTRLVASDKPGPSHEQKRDNIVLIGGTLGNPTCMYLCDKLKLARRLKVYWFCGGVPSDPQRKGYVRPEKFFLSTEDHVTIYGTDFATEPDGRKRIMSDCGLVLKFANPLMDQEGRHNQVIVVAGNYGVGTLAAARAAINEGVLAEVRKTVRCSPSFGFVVKGYPRDWDVKDYELVHSFPIPS